MRRGKNRRNEARNKALRAFKRTANDLNEALHSTIVSPRNWSGFEQSVTRRKNGEIVRGAFRNIEDLGNLESSQDMQVNGFKATYRWDGNGQTDVISVFFGHRSGDSFVSGRDWITPTLAEIDIPFTYKINGD